MRNPYDVLGITKDADDVKVKKAYHKLALQYHPDRNPDDPDAETKFKEISEAYEVLSSPEKRKMYDQYGHTNPRNIDPFEHIRSSMGFDMGDIFGGGRRQARMKGDDIRKSINISFMEAAHGCSKKISVSYNHQCKSCHGNGSENGTSMETCETCDGSGRVGMRDGFIQILQHCPSCHGRGMRVIKQCLDCKGSGKDSKVKNLKVTVPVGVEPGTVMRLSGKGMPSEYGAENGDLYLAINISRHPKFDRAGPNIYSVEEIGYIDAILGTKLKVETIHGHVKLTVPNGTQPESMLKISGKGIKLPDYKGDHMVRVKVRIPETVSEEDKELLEQIKGGK